MPNLMTENMENMRTQSNYKFSGMPINELEGTSEYTLVTIVTDCSGSVHNFVNDLEKMVKSVVDGCKKSPRSENLMIRVVTFDNDLHEFHGFKRLDSVDSDDYDNFINIGGATALCDAVQSSVEATSDYGQILIQQEYDANGIVYIITDGQDNASAATRNSVKNAIEGVRFNEQMNDLTTILIGVGVSGAEYFENFKDETGLDQFVDIGDATPSNLAKLGKMISRSVSSTSTSLHQGKSASQNSSSLLTI